MAITQADRIRDTWRAIERMRDTCKACGYADAVALCEGALRFGAGSREWRQVCDLLAML